jgi:hypothetical protein
MSPILSRVAVLCMAVTFLAGCSRTLEPGVILEGKVVKIVRPSDGPIVTGANDSTIASILSLYNTCVSQDASQKIVLVKHRRNSTYLVTPEQQLTYREYQLLGPVSYIVDLDLKTVEGAPRD